MAPYPYYTPHAFKLFFLPGFLSASAGKHLPLGQDSAQALPRQEAFPDLLEKRQCFTLYTQMDSSGIVLNHFPISLAWPLSP